MRTDKHSFHLAGIIPVACQPLDFGMPWHDCLQPINKGYLLIERAVLECATAGCETIWVICPKDIKPLIKSVLGEYIEDPVWHNRKKDVRARTKKKYIPIYYVAIHPKDQEIRGCLGWSILYGATVADHVSRTMSKWLAPNRFYVSFPYGIYPVDFLREHRISISSPRRLVVQSENGSFKFGFYTGFTFNMQDLKQFKKKFRKEETGLWDMSSPLRDGIYPTKRLPIEKRYAGRFLTLEKIFGECDFEPGTLLIEPEWYYWADSWEGLIDYYQCFRDLEKPEGLFTRTPANKIGSDED